MQTPDFSTCSRESLVKVAEVMFAELVERKWSRTPLSQELATAIVGLRPANSERDNRAAP